MSAALFNLFAVLLSFACRLGAAFLPAAVLTVAAQYGGLSDAGSWLALGVLTARLFVLGSPANEN